MNNGRRWLLWSLLGLAGFVFCLGVALFVAPAAWLDFVFERATAGRLRLAEAKGSLWQGSGQIVLADNDKARLSTAADTTSVDWPGLLAGIVIPGRCDWQLKAWPLLLGQLDLTLKFEHMREVVKLTGNHSRVSGTAGAFDLPQIQMDRLGSPWNTIRPTGALSVRWEGFQIERGRFTGKASISIAQVASALSPVKPLGSYRIDVDGVGSQANLSIATLSGPLALEGQGQWNQRAGLRFTAYAQAREEQIKLQPLLSLLGKRDGDRTIIRLGAV
jgi:general secretion pathway protein N